MIVRERVFWCFQTNDFSAAAMVLRILILPILYICRSVIRFVRNPILILHPCDIKIQMILLSLIIKIGYKLSGKDSGIKKSKLKDDNEKNDDSKSWRSG